VAIAASSNVVSLIILLLLFFFNLGSSQKLLLRFIQNEPEIINQKYIQLFS